MYWDTQDVQLKVSVRMSWAAAAGCCAWFVLTLTPTTTTTTHPARTQTWGTGQGQVPERQAEQDMQRHGLRLDAVRKRCHAVLLQL